MPFPPPPPPPGPPPPPSFPSGGSLSGPPKNAASDPNSRNQLLQSIKKGTTLKKAVTNDRSAPLIGGSKPTMGGSSGGGAGSPSSGNPRPITSGSATLGRNNALAGLFAGGMPKLKPTGLDIGQTSPGQSQSLSSLPVANNSVLHSKLDSSKSQFSMEVKNRGPPPQPPPANQKPNMPQSASDSVLTGASLHSRSNSTTSLNNGWSSPSSNSSHSHSTSPAGSVRQPPQRVISKAPVGGYGKPNVAPKPPGINTTCASATNLNSSGGSGSSSTSSPSKPSRPPEKLMKKPSIVTRAQSMRASRRHLFEPAPPGRLVFPPESGTPVLTPSQPTELGRMGTPPSFHQSQDSLMQTPPPPKAGTLPMPRLGAGPGSRPRLRPPLQRPPPPPPSRLAMSSPPCPPPPPPTSAPPPPPHRIPNVNMMVPPPPPLRHSSMRNGMTPFTGDLESRFSDIFHQPHEFPPPQPFLGVPKVYNSRTAKQQAPLPPTHIQLGNKMWSRDNTSTC